MIALKTKIKLKIKSNGRYMLLPGKNSEYIFFQIYEKDDGKVIHVNEPFESHKFNLMMKKAKTEGKIIIQQFSCKATVIKDNKGHRCSKPFKIAFFPKSKQWKLFSHSCEHFSKQLLLTMKKS